MTTEKQEAGRPFLPDKLTLPFFAYGLFKPGQLAYFQIGGLVATTSSASIPGELLVRDGVPFLNKAGQGRVDGAVVKFDPGTEEQAYDCVAHMEPRHLYSWSTVRVDEATANVLVGRRPKQGRPLHSPNWDGWRDPLFEEALDLVEQARQARGNRNFRSLFKRQMAYMLLWSAIERYLTLRYSLGENVVKKVKKLASEPAFAAALRRHVDTMNEVRRSSDPTQAAKLDPNDPERSALYYYQVRSNVTHRGKTAPDEDGAILEAALDELLPIFREVLEAAQSQAESDQDG